MVLRFFLLAGTSLLVSCANIERNNPEDSGSGNYRGLGNWLIAASSSSSRGTGGRSSSSNNACVMWSWVVTTPTTCEATGVETRVCASDPSITEGMREITKLEWGEWEITTPATSTTLAEGRRTCPNGDIEDEKDLAICGTNPNDVFAPEEQFCQEGTNVVKELCGGEAYPAIKYCSNGTLKDYSYCGPVPYTDTQFCYDISSKVGNLCGNRAEHYDPDLYECKPNINANGIYLKNKPKDSVGKEYEAVLIGTQTWMAENLNYNASGSKCGNGSNLNDANTSTCNTYGRLYNWATAMGLTSNYNSSSYNPSPSTKYRGVCPKDWHIPNDTDWNILMKFVNPSCSNNSNCANAGTKLKAAGGWSNYGNGTDNYGFSALPGGYGSSGSLNNVGRRGHWWSARENSNYYAYSRTMNDVSDFATWDTFDKLNLFSVRCVQD